MAYNPFTWTPGSPVPQGIVNQYAPQAAAPVDNIAPAAPNAGQSDMEKLAQLMQGNLKGQLSSGDKLMALSALLRSVSRGSTQSPQDVIQSIKQQKLQEVQGRIQLAEMQKQAKAAALAQQYRQQLIDAETDPRRKAYLQVADADTINKIIQEQFKGGGDDQYLQRLATYEKLKATDPARAKVYWDMINRPQIIGSMDTGLQRSYFPEPNLGAPSQGGIDPAAIAEAKKRGLI